MTRKCPLCRAKLIEQWQEKKQGEWKIRTRMLVCPKCGYEEFPLPTHGYKNGKLVSL